MGYPTITPVPSIKTALGFAWEITDGTPVSATDYCDILTEGLAYDPGWFSPETMRGRTTSRAYSLLGLVKAAGPLGIPVFPDTGSKLQIAGWGRDKQVGYGVSGVPAIASAGSPCNTTLSGNVIAGATSLPLTSLTGAAQYQVIAIVDPVGGNETVIATGAPGGGTVAVTALQFAHLAANATVFTAGARSSGSVSAAGSTIALQTGLGALFTNNDIVQIDVNSVSGSVTSEVHKVTVSADTLTLVTTSTLDFAHATNIQVFHVANPWHRIIPSATNPKGLTVEKLLGNGQSEQYQGAKVMKLGYSFPVSNAPADCALDIMAQDMNILDSSSGPISTPAQNPLTFERLSFMAFGNDYSAEIENLKLSVDRKGKEKYTYSGPGKRGPGFRQQMDFLASLTFTAVFSSLDDATHGWTAKLKNGTQGEMIAAAINADGTGIKFDFPYGQISKGPLKEPKGDFVSQDITIEVLDPPGNSNVGFLHLFGNQNYNSELL